MGEGEGEGMGEGMGHFLVSIFLKRASYLR